MNGFIATIRNGHTDGCNFLMGWGDRNVCDCGYEEAIKRVEKQLAWLATLEQTLNDEGKHGVISRALERFELRRDAT